MATKKPGRKYEEAVYAFTKTLDQAAEVLFDHKEPDRDTGELRQCDVWIKAKFAGHWPLSILVSCKDQKRKLNASDIGVFCDEKRSTGASTGVIYSRSGFTRPAVKKAQANGISCCRLYDNEPADLPTAIWLEHFLCKSTIELRSSKTQTENRLGTWNDLFNLELEVSKETVLSVIARTFSVDEEKAVLHQKSSLGQKFAFPEDWKSELSLRVTGFEQDLVLTVTGRWKKYRARSEASLLNGS
jgi:hypothetical protein